MLSSMNQNSPKISVVLPTHGRADLLIRAMDSIARQSMEDWECVVVSDDPEEFKLKRSLVEQMKDPRFKFVEGKKPGANASRNVATEHALGEIIAYIDDDDYWLENKLFKHLEAHQTADFVFSNCVLEYEVGERCLRYVFPTDKNSLDGIGMKIRTFQFCPKTSSCVSVSRKFVNKEKWDESLVSFQDWDLWFRIFNSHSLQIGFVEDPVCVFVQHLGLRTSRNVEKRLFGLRKVLEKHFKPEEAAQVLYEQQAKILALEFRERKALYTPLEKLKQGLRLLKYLRCNKTRMSLIAKAWILPSPYSIQFAHLHSDKQYELGSEGIF